MLLSKYLRLNYRTVPSLRTMKKLFLLLAMSLCSTAGFSNCTNAYASAGYTLSHAKKSMEANNFEHQQYYAQRALTALEKTRDENETCGCPGASDPILDGIENLNTALSQEKWDNARFYTKKALEDAERVLYSLDVCAMGKEPVQEDTASDDPQTDISPESPDSGEVSADAEWDAKLQIKQAAEDEIAALEKSIRNMAALFECERAMQIVKDRRTKTDEELRAESLSSIKSFYMSQAATLHNKALFALLECSKK